MMMAEDATMDGNSFDRLKALFDEMGVQYQIYDGTGLVSSSGEFTRDRKYKVEHGGKAIVTDEGEGYCNFHAEFDFDADGSFRGYGVFE